VTANPRIGAANDDAICAPPPKAGEGPCTPPSGAPPASDSAHLLDALNATAFVVMADAQGRIMEVNDKTCDISGHARADLTGRSFRAFVSLARAAAAVRRMRRALASAGTWRGDLCLRTAAGGHVWADVTVTARRGGDGAAGYTAIGIDITQRKQVEEAYRRSEALYRSTMMALGEGILVLDGRGRIMSANPAAERILGLSHDTLVAGKLRWQAIREDGSDFPVREFPAMATLATGLEHRDVVMGLRRGDDTITWISVNSEPIFEQGDAMPSRVVTSFSDITARKQAQDVLSEAIAAIPDGFAVYDRNDRLLICNDAYRDIYSLSAEAIRPGERFETILYYGLRNGQYPQAGETDAQRAAWFDERLRLHRQRCSDAVQQLPGGRWLQLREWRTPSGYTVGLRVDVSELKRQSATLQAVVDNFPGGISFFDADLNLVACNSQFRTLLDLPDALFAEGLPTLEMIFRVNAGRGEYGPGDPDEQVRARLELARRAEPHMFERLRPDGTVIEVRGTPIPGGGFITTYVDITARRAAEKLLSDSERRAREKSAALQITLAHMSQGLTMFDAEGRLMVWNDRYVEMYGLSPDIVKAGASVESILACRRRMGGDPGFEEFVSELRREIGQGRAFSTTVRLADGRTVLIVNTPIAEGGWVSTHEDITVRERIARQISHLAHHDVLTGLANRAAFKAHVETAIARAARRGESIGLLLIDLDRFKAVNDTLGHAAGDRLLQMVAERMRQQVRAGDVVARLGGDEFAILQDSVPHQREGAIALATRLIAVLGEIYDLEGRHATVGASIGIVIAPQDGDKVDQLLRNADLALYKVKGGGRNDFRIYDKALDSEAHDRCRIECELREAIADDALQLHYQPIVSLADGGVCGMEALVRWPHPTRGFMTPDRFIDIAEDSGLIVQLGEWAIQRACRDAALWPDHVKVAVNISPSHIKKRTLFDCVARALAQHGVRPQRLEIEVTETVLLRHDEEILAELRRLRSLGVSVVLDDFGIGYSSLSHLRMFTFDKVKIDRSFVGEITERPDCAAIVCAIAGLARSLGMATTAEGVETEQQLKLLRAAGCTQAQGYLFDRPQPAAAINLAATIRTLAL
jgi:diguanylate cyclase (GGDEF)-like protein/PAS domain S-box-containing protein